MTRKLLALCCLLPALGATAITYTYGDFDKSAKTCTLTGWGGLQPSSGKLTLKETCEQDGVTYKVTAIAPHALDNLTEVTEITIPANVKKIGGATSWDNGSGTSAYLGSCGNFFNCTKLTKFKVATGNTAFAATGAGVLMFKGGTIIVRVPQEMAVTDGVYKMSVSVSSICPDAFRGNTSISTIALSPHVNFNSLLLDSNEYDCGFWSMKNLEAFTINGASSSVLFTIIDGALYDYDKTGLLSCPPCRKKGTLTLPSTVNVIATSALRNVVALTTVSMGSVTHIKGYALSGSGITSMSLPASVTRLGDGVLSGCPSLKTISIPRRLPIPDYFALDCKELTSVELPEGSPEVGTGAFKGCTRLEQFPFSTKTVFSGDSIFTGCGFKTVYFEPGVTPTDEDYDFGTAMFAENYQLTQIDMGNINKGVAEPDRCGIPLLFASSCPKLRLVRFPANTSFWGSTEGLRPNMGYNSPVDYIHLSSFTVTSSPVVYYDYGQHYPTVYLHATDCARKRWPLNKFFQAANNSVCVPQVYCEAYTMEDGAFPDEYVYAGGNYFIPGGTLDNYLEAQRKARHVEEMYKFRIYATDGFLCLDLTDRIDGLEFTQITVDGPSIGGPVIVGLPDAAGKVKTTFPAANVQTVTVEYNLRGSQMKTIYPVNHDWAGVDGVTTDCEGDSVTIGVDARMLSFSREVRFTVADMSGRVVASGRGLAVSLDGCPAGGYVVSAATSAGDAAVKKIMLR